MQYILHGITPPFSYKLQNSFGKQQNPENRFIEGLPVLPVFGGTDGTVVRGFGS